MIYIFTDVLTSHLPTWVAGPDSFACTRPSDFPSVKHMVGLWKELSPLACYCCGAIIERGIRPFMQNMKEEIYGFSPPILITISS